MHNSSTHTIHHQHHHWVWSNELEPVYTARPGETVQFTTMESSGGQIGPMSTAADAAALDFSRVNPVTGPVVVEGAEPGDVLKLRIEETTACGWGWTAIIPNFGLLPEHFPEPALRLWSYDSGSSKSVAWGDIARIPLKPMIGSIGLAPEAPGEHDILPPRRVGGTMDIRDLSAGAVLYLPVEAQGGLLSVGDTHAAQGDGEVCGTGLESAIDVAVTIELIKNTPLKFPRLEVFSPVTDHLDAAGYEVTTGIGPDLFRCAKESVMAMVDLIAREHRVSPEDAYMLCSLCGDLRISEIVDRPHGVVSFYFPRIVFE
jgi:acetamidase/formamidase